MFIYICIKYRYGAFLCVYACVYANLYVYIYILDVLDMYTYIRNLRKNCI